MSGVCGILQAQPLFRAPKKWPWRNVPCLAARPGRDKQATLPERTESEREMRGWDSWQSRHGRRGEYLDQSSGQGQAVARVFHASTARATTLVA
jgi:hypothetical protein